MPKLSVTIITRNEAAHIAAALESVAWADEAVVVDSGSTDATIEIARRHASRVAHRDWTGYADQKNHAAALAAHDWILSIDADERVPPALAQEIRGVLASEPQARGYRIPRTTWHLGRWIRSTDWYPDHQLRLYDRRAGRWEGRHVHESVQVDGTVARLSHEIEHYAFRDLGDHLDTLNRYSALAAQALQEQGRRAGPLDLVAYPAAAFVRNYLLRGGLRDGVPGLIVSLMNAYYVFLKFARLWERQTSTDGRQEPPGMP